jgi:hypothetical protein
LRIQVSRRWILEGGTVEEVVAHIHSVQDSQEITQLSMELSGDVYEVNWSGGEGDFLVSVSARDASGNRGHSELRPVAIRRRAPGGTRAETSDRWQSTRLPSTDRLSFFTQLAVAADGITWYGATSSKLYRSDDAGANWHPTSLMLRGTGNWPQIHVDADDPLTVYVVQSDPLYSRRRFSRLSQTSISRDGGDTWERVRVPSGVASVSVDPVLPGRLYSSEAGNALVSEDEGRSWRPLATDGTVIQLSTHPADLALTYVIVRGVNAGLLT